MTVAQFDVIEISARGEFAGVEDTVNVYQFQLQTAAPVADATAITQLAGHLDDIYDNIQPLQTTSYLYRDLSFRNITQDTVLGVVPWPTKVAGASVGKAMPPGVAGLINMATNIARVVLRKYLGGLTDAVLEIDGTFTSVLVAALVQFAADLLALFITGSETWAYGHLSPKTAAFEQPVAGVVTDIPAYQRRRKQGRGV